MKHVKALGRSRPVPAQNEVWCQIAVVLSVLGLPVPKDLIEKCIGL